MSCCSLVSISFTQTVDKRLSSVALPLIAIGRAVSATDTCRQNLHVSSQRCYFKFANKNDQRSAYSSIDLLTGVPAPWPARVSIRISVGLSHDWAA